MFMLIRRSFTKTLTAATFILLGTAASTDADIVTVTYSVVSSDFLNSLGENPPPPASNEVSGTFRFTFDTSIFEQDNVALSQTTGLDIFDSNGDRIGFGTTDAGIHAEVFPQFDYAEFILGGTISGVEFMAGLSNDFRMHFQISLTTFEVNSILSSLAYLTTVDPYYQAQEITVQLIDVSVSGTRAPTSLNVIRGTVIAGGLDEVLESDNESFQLNPGITLNQFEPPVWIQFEGELPNDQPDSLSVLLEAHANTVGLTQSIEMFNFVSGDYELVDSRNVAFINDAVIEIQLGGDVTRFVEPATGLVRARTGWIASGPVLLYPWTISIDQAGWGFVQN